MYCAFKTIASASDLELRTLYSSFLRSKSDYYTKDHCWINVAFFLSDLKQKYRPSFAALERFHVLYIHPSCGLSSRGVPFGQASFRFHVVLLYSSDTRTYVLDYDLDRVLGKPIDAVLALTDYLDEMSPFFIDGSRFYEFLRFPAGRYLGYFGFFRWGEFGVFVGIYNQDTLGVEEDIEEDGDVFEAYSGIEWSDLDIDYHWDKEEMAPAYCKELFKNGFEFETMSALLDAVQVVSASAG